MDELPYAGVIPATLCPFREDESIDEDGLWDYIQYLASVPGVTGLTCNGHTGEVMSLTHRERAQVTRLVAEAAKAVNPDIRVISGVNAEGSAQAVEDALAAREAGADAILLMPPHHWLRFGRTPETAIGFVHDVATGAGVDIVLHQYPAWTKASYSLAEMLEIVRIPQVKCIKMGTRDMARWGHDYRTLKAAAPHVTILTCHDEYLLASLLEGADGALVGFAGFVPELVVELVRCALAGDLAGARQVQERLAPLCRLVYRFGEPSGDAHQRMKCAMYLQGRFPSPHMRRPLRPLPPAEVARIRQELATYRERFPEPRGPRGRRPRRPPPRRPAAGGACPGACRPRVGSTTIGGRAPASASSPPTPRCTITPTSSSPPTTRRCSGSSSSRTARAGPRSSAPSGRRARWSS